MTAEEFQRFACVSRETLQDFLAFHALILKWQAKMNLVSPTTLGEVWDRHFADSAQLFPLLEPGWNELADLGSGAGFPGLVLAILSRGQNRACRFHLIEADGRKAAFLIDVALNLGLLNTRLFVHAQRAERLGASPLAGRMDAVTARALAPLPELLGFAEKLLRADGACLFLKGARAGEELVAAETAGWRFTAERHPSRVGDGTVLALRGLSRAATLDGRARAKL